MLGRFSSFFIFLNIHYQIKVASHNNLFTVKRKVMIERILEKIRIVVVWCLNVNQSYNLVICFVIYIASLFQIESCC